MKHLDFILWVLGWPLTIVASNYLEDMIQVKLGKEPRPMSDRQTGFVAIIWIIIALLVY